MQLLEALNYMGPNRRFECTAIEMLLHFSDSERELLSHEAESLGTRMRDLFEGANVELASAFTSDPCGPDPFDLFGSLFCQASIALQRWAGHDVSQWQVIPGSDDQQRRLIFQHEERATAEKAGDTVMLLMTQLLPGLDWQSRTGITETNAIRLLLQFRDFATPLAMPRDTLDIIAAAKALDLPCVRLERDPYHPLPGAHRIRANSLLMLGHSRYREIIDGTLCVTRSHPLLPLVHDHAARQSALGTMGLLRPGTRHDGPVRAALLAGAMLVWSDTRGDSLEPETVSQLEHISRQVPCGLLRVSYSVRDDGRDIAVLDMDFAPRLDELPLEAAQRKRAAEAFVRWIFPVGSESRIPSIAVTGTNGKSTTTTMVDHVMRQQGLVTGVAFSSGVRINGQTTETGDLAGLMGHYRVFESPEPQVAILETARGGVAQRGFSFDWCNTAVCLNVDDDHIGLLGIDTIEQMAELKRSVVARARDAVVLNGDDPHCLKMAATLTARRNCLVSTLQDIESLRKRSPEFECFCVLESVDGSDWIVFYQGPERIPLLRACDIPATYGGKLRHNVINAAHAAAACLLTGVSGQRVGEALSSFKLDAETLLGRWNVVEGLPFEAVFDYAHNEHGIRHLVDSLARFDISGTRRVAFAYSGDRGEESVQSAMRTLSRGFDRYLVTEFDDSRGREKFEMREIVIQSLQAAGVEPGHIATFDSEDAAVQAGLEASKAGDLLVVLGGKKSMQRIWQQMCDFRDQVLKPE